MKIFGNIAVFVWLSVSLMLFGCSSSDESPASQPDNFVRAADLSFLPEIEQAGTTFYNGDQPVNALEFLNQQGCNTVRLRLWVNPVTAHSGMTEVRAMATRARNLNMKVWLSVHFSDTWADPGQQQIPQAWENLGLAALKQTASAYAVDVVNQIHPDIFQIGNETNDGLLWPMGKLSVNPQQTIELFSAIATSVRNASAQTKIMIHYAGWQGASGYFENLGNVDYDYIGLSYYPIWHGQNLQQLESAMNTLHVQTGKEILIAETAYPFTLGWDDWTNNIVGLENQLIPSYPASPAGQQAFLEQIRNISQTVSGGRGFCYWGGEWVAFRGSEATNGSSFENQALFDFDHKPLPALSAFRRN